jgi:hypothetical protein
MNLTPQETKMLTRMRNEQARWPKVRWFDLVFGIAVFIACSFQIDRLLDLLTDKQMFGVVALLAPVIMVWMLFGGYKVVHALTNWHGDPERVLLLKAIEEIQEHSSEPPSAGDGPKAAPEK